MNTYYKVCRRGGAGLFSNLMYCDEGGIRYRHDGGWTETKNSTPLFIFKRLRDAKAWMASGRPRSGVDEIWRVEAENPRRQHECLVRWLMDKLDIQMFWKDKSVDGVESAPEGTYVADRVRLISKVRTNE